MLDRPHCHRTPKSRASNDRFARPLQGRSKPLGAQTAAKSRQPLSSSPALRTGADKQERSRDALRPSLANQRHQSCCLRKRGGGAPRGARVESAPALRMSASEPAASAASATDGPRYRGHPLAGALAFRRSVAALARLLPLAQLRAALTGILQQLAPPQTPFTSELLAPRSLCRRGRVRSRPGAGLRAPHAGTASHSASGIVSRSAPSECESSG
jgi:hypothetical protein